MNKIGICGHFAFGKIMLDGQTIKTKILYNELTKEFGQKNVLPIDTHGWRRAPFKLLYGCISVFHTCTNIIILPAQNGLKIFVPLFIFLKYFFNIKLHYVVIGGWLPELLQAKQWLLIPLKAFTGIYVETTSMKNKLDALGFKNIYIVPNFKQLHILKEDELVYKNKPPYEFCTFSRVMKEKGIEDAIAAIKVINEERHLTICHLDIYGQVDSNYINKFEEILANAPNYIKYKGEVPFDKSTEVLKNYYALLFPTHFFTEGLPGTIIDAYAAGLPVIASNWENAGEFINDGKTGFIFNVHDIEGIKHSILKVLQNKNKYKEMKFNCLEQAKIFLPQRALKILFKKLD